MNFKKGVFYQSAVSGMYYRSYKAAGEISCVMINSERFYPKSSPTCFGCGRTYIDGQCDHSASCCNIHENPELIGA